MKIHLALQEVHDAERALAGELRRVGEEHKADHDVFHLTRTLSGWCDEHLERLVPHGDRYGIALSADGGEERGPLARLGEKGSELAGRRPEPGVLLLHDLRELHLAACRASLAWTVLGQGAQAVRDRELLDTVTACHPETIRTMKWTVQRIKEAAPQVLAS